MILKGYPRISETFISNEILLLEQLGFSIRIFSMRRPRENFAHASVDRIRADVDYLPETLLAPLPRFLYHHLRLARKIPQTYRQTLALAIRRFRRTRKPATFKHFLQAGFLVEKLLPGRRLAHLHAHFAHSPASVALFASRLSGIGFSFTAHAKDIYTSDPAQLAEKLQCARFAVTCTEYNRRHLNRLAAGSGANIYRIYHGIDINQFDGERDRRGGGPYRILTVARLTAKKGLPTVYEAVRQLHRQGLPVAHTLIGDGEDRRQILTLIRDLGISSICCWLGTQPHSVVQEHYRRADVFALGCRVAANGDRDGIPNVLMESMAMGVPVVATAVSAIPELVQNEQTGLLVPPNDPQRLADAIARVLGDAALRRRLTATARKRVQERFDNQRLIEELAAIYRTEVKELFPENGLAR
jgi:glycosyltransferase involved in cell wall biosynthesis